MRLRNDIREGFARLQPRRLTGSFERQAAVLMPIFEQDGEPHFLLTRRTDEVRTHKGQISFPGGMQLDGESLRETALRETQEEVGIDCGRIEVLGRFHDYVSINGFLVAPFAGLIEVPFTVAPQEHEVAEVLRVPFCVFEDPDRLRAETMLHNGQRIQVFFYRYGSQEIWGLTAHIIKDFMGEISEGIRRRDEGRA